MSDSKYDFIAQDLMSKIFQNYYQKKLPTQRDLADMYGVSRFTIQKALAKLQSIGMIKAVQGDGLYITNNILGNTLIYNSMTENSYDNIVSKVVYFRKIKSTKELDKIFGLNGDEYIWEFQRLRIVNYVICQIETTYLRYDLFPDFREEDVVNSIQGYVMRKKMKISYFITDYQAIKINKEQSLLLNEKKGYPAMKITSRGVLSTGQVYEYSTVIALHYNCTYINPFNKAIYDARKKRKQ